MRILILAIILSLFSPLAHAQNYQQENETAKQVFFSPDGGCEAAVVHELDKAKSSIFMAIYVFNSKKIGAALLRAKARGVKVWVLVDRVESFPKFSASGWLAERGLYVLKDGKHPKFHDKFVVIDAKTILTGSFNYTSTAEQQNAENLLILRDEQALAAKYLEHFAEHASHAETRSK